MANVMGGTVVAVTLKIYKANNDGRHTGSLEFAPSKVN